MSKKIPVSVLILLHDNAGNVLLFNRLNPDGFWQSITGSLNTPNEPPFQAALREVAEETGFRLHPNQLRALVLRPNPRRQRAHIKRTFRLRMAARAGSRRQSVLAVQPRNHP